MTDRAKHKQYPLSSPPPLHPSLLSRNPLAWLAIFGPGAVIASLTIGTGELIFSSRGGAIFGYRILFLVVVIAVLKWSLVYSTARHMVLSGVHPFQRWVELPLGPRGWFPLVLFLLAAVCIPVWVSFHASVLGNLISTITGTREVLHGAVDHLWGGAVLAAVVLLSLAGGYTALEKVQLLIVTALLAAVTFALVLFKPDWLELLLGAVVPRRLEFPDWLLRDPRPEIQKIAARPVWEEATLYVGVIGGASYDYLAYTSFLRDKGWGLAGSAGAGRAELEGLAGEPLCTLKTWVRAPLIDLTLSFLVVVVFCAVFVASGVQVLGPARQIPGDGNFLEHQAQFITRIHPWLYPLYAVGALLTILGTLYGTIEVAPTVLREVLRSLRPDNDADGKGSRLLAIGWCASGAFLVLAWSFAYHLASGRDRPPGLTEVLKPANLFTGVLSCGLVCLLNPWMDRRFLPRPLQMSGWLTLLNLGAGVVFVALGLKGYWDYQGWLAMCILCLTVAAGFLAAWADGRWKTSGGTS